MLEVLFSKLIISIIIRDKMDKLAKYEPKDVKESVIEKE